MVINLKVRGINRGMSKLIQTITLIIIINKSWNLNNQTLICLDFIILIISN